MNEFRHTPVLVKEILELLQPQPNQNFVDATVGGGGHAAELLRHTGPHGALLGLDLDSRAVATAHTRLRPFGSRVKIIQANYADLSTVRLQYRYETPLHGIMVDLGVSSYQLDASARGFSFKDAGSLDMRFDTSQGIPVSKLLKSLSVSQLAAILRKYGEVPHAMALARRIIAARDAVQDTLLTVPMLVSAVSSKHRPVQKRTRIHPATLVFQALRILVNKELENLTRFLPAAMEALEVGGRLAVISYHSLEDRIVKDFFRRESKGCLCAPTVPVCVCGHRARIAILHKGVITPTPQEVRENPRARSAKLRAVQKIE